MTCPYIPSAQQEERFLEYLKAHSEPSYPLSGALEWIQQNIPAEALVEIVDGYEEGEYDVEWRGRI
jgi:hypothetical protein